MTQKVSPNGRRNPRWDPKRVCLRVGVWFRGESPSDGDLPHVTESIVLVSDPPRSRVVGGLVLLLRHSVFGLLSMVRCVPLVLLLAARGSSGLPFIQGRYDVTLKCVSSTIRDLPATFRGQLEIGENNGLWGVYPWRLGGVEHGGKIKLESSGKCEGVGRYLDAEIWQVRGDELEGTVWLRECEEGKVVEEKSMSGVLVREFE